MTLELCEVPSRFPIPSTATVCATEADMYCDSPEAQKDFEKVNDKEKLHQHAFLL